MAEVDGNTAAVSAPPINFGKLLLDTEIESVVNFIATIVSHYIAKNI